MNDHIALLQEVDYDTWLYPIYIPSYTRAGTAPLLNLLKDAPERVQARVYVVVRPEEFRDYGAQYPWATLITVREPGLGPARSRALRHALRSGNHRLIMMDDDIKHVSLLERVVQPNGREHTRRHSSKVSGIPEPELMLKSLAVTCFMIDNLYDQYPHAVYGACRNALFSGDVDTSIGATMNRGTFPASVMFYDVSRMENLHLPTRFHMHGEDIAFAMDVMTRGQDWFTIPVSAFDQDGVIESTIPLDPNDSVARRIDIENAAIEYPLIHPYLRESVRNKAGGVMRVGVNWKRWYKDTDSEAINVPVTDLIGHIK